MRMLNVSQKAFNSLLRLRNSQLRPQDGNLNVIHGSIDASVKRTKTSLEHLDPSFRSLENALEGNRSNFSFMGKLKWSIT